MALISIASSTRAAGSVLARPVGRGAHQRSRCPRMPGRRPGCRHAAGLGSLLCDLDALLGVPTGQVLRPREEGPRRYTSASPRPLLGDPVAPVRSVRRASRSIRHRIVTVFGNAERVD